MRKERTFFRNIRLSIYFLYYPDLNIEITLIIRDYTYKLLLLLYGWKYFVGEEIGRFSIFINFPRREKNYIRVDNNRG